MRGKLCGGGDRKVLVASEAGYFETLIYLFFFWRLSARNAWSAAKSGVD
jgi:hypothetical protein